MSEPDSGTHDLPGCQYLEGDEVPDEELARRLSDWADLSLNDNHVANEKRDPKGGGGGHGGGGGKSGGGSRTAGKSGKSKDGKPTSGAYYGFGVSRPPGLAHNPLWIGTGGRPSGASDDWAIEVLDGRTITTYGNGTANASDKAIVGVVRLHDICDTTANLYTLIDPLKTIQDKKAYEWLDGYMGAFRDVRSSAAKGRTSWNPKIDTFRAMTKTLAESGVLPTAETKRMKALSRYLERDSKTSMIKGRGDPFFDNDWRSMCTLSSGGVLQDTAISGDEQKKSGDDGYNIVKGLREFSTTVANDWTHEGKNSTQFVKSFFDKLNTWYITNTNKQNLLDDSQVFIKAIEDYPSLKEKKDIKKAYEALSSIVNRESHPQDYAYLIAALSESGASHNTGPVLWSTIATGLSLLAASSEVYGLITGA